MKHLRGFSQLADKYLAELQPSHLFIPLQFEALAGTHDPNAIAHLVARHPYHIDGLLTLADVYKQMGEMQTVAELLERCLYSFECSWHPSFNISLGTCRIAFDEEPNRAFYQALFRHMQHLGRRGCHRTALEVRFYRASSRFQSIVGRKACLLVVEVWATECSQIAADVLVEDRGPKRLICTFRVTVIVICGRNARFFDVKRS